MVATHSTQAPDPARVAVVTPTYNRAVYLERTLGYFRGQECHNAELGWFILDDSPSPHPAFESRIGDDVFYRWLPERLPLGAKRNRLNDMAQAWGAEYVCAMDDDDWYGPAYVSDMIGMLRHSSQSFAGSSENYFYHVQTGDILKMPLAVSFQ